MNEPKPLPLVARVGLPDWPSFARQLERELASLADELRLARERVVELEKRVNATYSRSYRRLRRQSQSRWTAGCCWPYEC